MKMSKTSVDAMVPQPFPAIAAGRKPICTTIGIKIAPLELAIAVGC